jgi:hypothetical protein
VMEVCAATRPEVVTLPGGNAVACALYAPDSDAEVRSVAG